MESTINMKIITNFENILTYFCDLMGINFLICFTRYGKIFRVNTLFPLYYFKIMSTPISLNQFDLGENVINLSFLHIF